MVVATTTRRRRSARRTKTYSTIWRNKFLTTDAKTLADMAAGLAAAAAELAAMVATGKVALSNPEPADDYAFLTTNDADVANRFGFNEDRDDEDADA
jgi:hypothetical protein